ALRIPGQCQSPWVGEIVAVLRAAQVTPNFVPLCIVTTSKYLLNALTKHFTVWENRGWIGIETHHLLKPTIMNLRRRSAPTTFRWLKTGSSDPNMMKAAQLAEEGVKKDHDDILDLAIDPKFDIQGAKLVDLTQSLAYAGIVEAKQTPMRGRTKTMTEQVQSAIKDFNGHTPSITNIWKSLRSKDIRNNIADFMWKAMHQAYRVGSYWANIAGYEERVNCSKCAQEESLEHIILTCNENGRSLVWDLARELLAMRSERWPALTVGSILGCSLHHFRDSSGASDLGRARLYRIIISESVFLIWKLRNERRITHADDPSFSHSPLKIRRQWVHAINTRLGLDREMTNRRKYGSAALSSDLVLATWRKTLRNETELPENWISAPELLQKKKKKKDISGRLDGSQGINKCIQRSDK
ncbi:hypothetical protein K474DRAFT_1589718, partial [Panus rudis PR-1116 ss-1]